jgi:K+ transporter
VPARPADHYFGQGALLLANDRTAALPAILHVWRPAGRRCLLVPMLATGQLAYHRSSQRIDLRWPSPMTRQAVSNWIRAPALAIDHTSRPRLGH